MSRRTMISSLFAVAFVVTFGISRFLPAPLTDEDQIGHFNRKTDVALEALIEIIELYHRDTGEKLRPEDWQMELADRYEIDQAFLDPWGNQIRYGTPEGRDGLFVWSLGKDHRQGGHGLDADTYLAIYH